MHLNIVATLSLLLTFAAARDPSSDSPGRYVELDFYDQFDLLANHNHLRWNRVLGSLEWDKGLAAKARLIAIQCRTQGTGTDGVKWTAEPGLLIYTGNTIRNVLHHHFEKWEDNKFTIKEMVGEFTEAVGCSLADCGANWKKGLGFVRNWSLVCKYDPPADYVPKPVRKGGNVGLGNQA